MRRIFIVIALVLGSAPAFAAMHSEPVEWTVGEDTFSGVLVYDDANSRPRPGLVMVPNWLGVNERSVERARGIAGDDYVVLVADVYGKGERPADKTEALAQVRKVYSDGGVTLRKRMEAAVAALKDNSGKAPLDSGRIGAFGFCFGGSAALELARTGVDLAGVVSIHGDLETYVPASQKIRTPILVLNGADDTSVPDAHIAAFEKEMDTAGADWQFVDFSGARHCFTQPEDANADPQNNCRYDERASKRAFAMLHAFFLERFGTK